MTFPRLSYSDRIEISERKQHQVLNFLAGGEQWSTLPVIAELLNLSERTAGRTVSQLVRQGFLQAERVRIASGKSITSTILVGITHSGMIRAGLPESALRPFDFRKVGALTMAHHIQTQRARLAAEAVGWNKWVPGRLLYGQGWHAVPDAISIDQFRKKCGIEIERTIKDKKDYRSLIARHLANVRDGHYEYVAYLVSPDMCPGFKKMLFGITYLVWKGKQIEFLDRHKKKFVIASWDEFPKNLTSASNDDGEMVDFSFRWERVRDDYFVAKRGDYELVVERPASYGPDAKTEYIWRLILQEDHLHMSESCFHSAADAQRDAETYVLQHVKL
ncbi:MAG: helix-turn-helix domain-containing protein [Betaproteobacteria bacterium]|nr:helix-turn-helix domain-containing protein [Betaproteobacteria bacterium]